MDSRFDIELIEVSKRYAGTLAVDRISLRIPRASYCCLLGPSGCGKTTTLRMIAGHEAITEGDILIQGGNVSNLAPIERGTAMMFQSYALFPHLSCLDNVAFSLKMRGVGKAERHARARDFLALVRMEDYAMRLPSQLSGGQQQQRQRHRKNKSRQSITQHDSHLPQPRRTPQHHYANCKQHLKHEIGRAHV